LVGFHPSVLHVWNTAGVACTLAKWTNKLYGAHTEVYAMEKHNRFGHLTYGEPCPNEHFQYRVIQNIPNFDIVHLHEFDAFANKIKKFYPEKPLVLHYHGSDIRGLWRRKRRHWEHANAILVSTRDLLKGAPERATYLHNPVDLEIFYPDPNTHEVDPKSALTFRHGAVDVAEKLAEKYDLELSVFSRNIKFISMPDILRRFSWYIDVKRNNGVLFCRRGDGGSMTGLEALACGLKVINSDGEIREGLPTQHRAENVVKTLYQIYSGLFTNPHGVKDRPSGTTSILSL